MSLVNELVEGVLAKDQANGWSRERIHYAHWTREGIARRRNVVEGTHGLTDLANKVRLVDAEFWEPPWRGVTPSELARAYLRHCRRRVAFAVPSGDMAKTRIPWREDQQDALETAQAPLYYDGTTHEGDFAVVDIDACYPSLYLPVGMAPRFFPDLPALGLSRLSGDGPPDWDRPAEWLAGPKAARNALVGITMTRGDTLEWLERGKLCHKKAINDCYSPSLAAWCVWCVGAVAVDLVRHFGFVTWATDGGVVPVAGAAPAQEHLRAWWGLSASVRAAGHGRVWNATTWAVGEHETAQPVKLDGEPVDLLPRVDVGWYRDTLRWAQAQAA